MLKSIFSLIVISFSVGFSMFFVVPLYQASNDSRTNLEKVQETFSNAQNITTLLNETESTLNGPEAVRQTDLFNEFLPTNVDSIRLANNLKEQAKVRGLMLMNLKVDDKIIKPTVSATSTSGQLASVVESAPAGDGAQGEKKDGKKFVTTKASFNITSTQSGFRIFLDDLEKSLGLINVTSLSFQEHPEAQNVKPVAASSKTPVPLLYDYTVEIETYSLK